MTDIVETTYDQDFVEWTREQARALRAAKDSGANLDLDWENLAEEIEDMGKSQRRELGSRSTTIIVHLLKLQCSRAQPPRAGWRATIARERGEIERLLDDSPSLRRELDSLVQKDIALAKRVAQEELAAFQDQALAFPERYSRDQILGNWYPEPPE